MKHEPFDELPWQDFPRAKIGHLPPVFNYEFPLKDDVCDIQDLARMMFELHKKETVSHGRKSHRRGASANRGKYGIRLWDTAKVVDQ